MGFYFNDEETEFKQHINLSESAWSVIDEDRGNYDLTESGILNRIITNFYQTAKASIGLQLNQRREKLEELYSSKDFDNIDKKIINLVIEVELKAFLSNLTNKKKNYQNGLGKKFRINNENVEMLKESIEDNYYDSNIGKYLKALLEEYATKPVFIREQILFKDTVDVINKAVSEQRKLKITLYPTISSNGEVKPRRKFYVAPYKITQDPNRSFNYLVGFSKEIDKDYKEIECCIRISRIEKINIQSSMGAKISKEKAKQLDNKLQTQTAMYMSGNPISIKVLFTKRGLQNFKKLVHLRPRIYHVDENNEYLYTFDCTVVQAINYFFKFGHQAIILEPEELKSSFKERYEKALNEYQNN